MHLIISRFAFFPIRALFSFANGLHCILYKKILPKKKLFGQYLRHSANAYGSNLFNHPYIVISDTSIGVRMTLKKRNNP